MDLRNEIEHIFNNGYAWYERNLGEAVIWHEYDARNTVYHSTYDEGGRRYTAGVYVPVMWVIVSEDRTNYAAEGRKPTEKIAMAISARSMDISGVSDPEDFARHLNDVVRYDGRLWKLSEYNIRGRVPDAVVLGVTGTQIYSDEEMVFDDLPPGMNLAGNHRPAAYPNNAQADFIFHDGPDNYATMYTNLDSDIILDGGSP